MKRIWNLCESVGLRTIKVVHLNTLWTFPFSNPPDNIYGLCDDQNQCMIYLRSRRTPIRPRIFIVHLHLYMVCMLNRKRPCEMANLTLSWPRFINNYALYFYSSNVDDNNSKQNVHTQINALNWPIWRWNLHGNEISKFLPFRANRMVNTYRCDYNKT